jgi:diacylglycerol kinase (ATP)
MGLEKTLFIVNSVKNNKEFEEIFKSFPAEKKDFIFTEYAGHAGKIAKDAARDFKTIVSVGGDGTLNEIINGAYGYDVDFAALPFGSGNDFLRTIGIKTVKQAFESIIGGNIINLDLGLAEFYDEEENRKSRLYINMASLGIGSLVVDNIKNNINKSYLPSLIETIAKNRPFDVKISIEGNVKHNGTLWEAQINNGKYVGKGMKSTPEADINDGKLDIMLVDGISKANLYSALLLIYPGLHTIHPSVHFYKGQRVEIHPNKKENLSLILDGEPSGFAPVKFRVMPGAIRFRYTGVAERVKKYGYNCVTSPGFCF